MTRWCERCFRMRSRCEDDDAGCRFAGLSPEMQETVRATVERLKNDTRTEAEKLAGAVAFVLDTRLGGE